MGDLLKMSLGTLTTCSHIGDTDIFLSGHEAQHGEDEEACVEAGEAVDDGHQQRVPGTTPRDTIMYTPVSCRKKAVPVMLS